MFASSESAVICVTRPLDLVRLMGRGCSVVTGDNAGSSIEVMRYMFDSSLSSIVWCRRPQFPAFESKRPTQVFNQQFDAMRLLESVSRSKGSHTGLQGSVSQFKRYSRNYPHM